MHWLGKAKESKEALNAFWEEICKNKIAELLDDEYPEENVMSRAIYES